MYLYQIIVGCEGADDSVLKPAVGKIGDADEQLPQTQQICVGGHMFFDPGNQIMIHLMHCVTWTILASIVRFQPMMQLEATAAK